MSHDTGPERLIFVISDSSGETASRAARVALEQFHITAEERRFPEVSSVAEIQKLMERAAESKAFVVYTLVKRELREAAQTAADERHVYAIDIFRHLLPRMGLWLGLEPHEEAGHVLNEEYFARIAATSFAQKHDDGQNLATLHTADLVVLGLSRSSKTPVSHELARSGLKVANIPLVLESAPPTVLTKIDPRKIFVLRLDPERLQKIRMSRLSSLGTKADSPYVDPAYIEQEYTMLDELLRKNRRWSVIKTTDRAIEEIATQIRTRYTRAPKAA